MDLLDQIRHEVRCSRRSLYAIAKAADVRCATLVRFMKAKKPTSTATLLKLIDELNLVVTVSKRSDPSDNAPVEGRGAENCAG